MPRLEPTGAAAKAWGSFIEVFRREGTESGSPYEDDGELQLLTQERLKQLAPAWEPRKTAAALDRALCEWLQTDKPVQSVQFVVGQPHGRHGEMLRHWADERKAKVIDPPSYEAILEGDLDWLEQWPGQDRLWVLPALEFCYLRNVRGVSIIRHLLGDLVSGRLGKGVVGCDSWAWAYLQRLWPLPRGDVLTLQSFDGARLARWFASSAMREETERICFRIAETGATILSSTWEEDEPDSEIIELAAHCRGNAATAISYWRRRLRVGPTYDEEFGNADNSGDAEDRSEADRKNEQTVWVSDTVDEPSLPDRDETTALLLHALLLHEGLPESLLTEVLPLPDHRCMSILLRMQQAGVVECRDSRWRVTVLAYANVRAFLSGRDYLTDGF